MTHMAEHLEAILLKENLSTTDVVNLLAGNRVLKDKGYGNGSKAYNLITDEQIAKNKTRNIIEKRRLIEEIWESSGHDKYRIELKGEFTFPRNYVFGWAKEKALSSGSLFEEFFACIRYAIDRGLITPQDWAASKRNQPSWLDEAREKNFPVDMPQPESNKEKPKKQESEPSEREINNSLRIIGAMRDILTSQDGDVKEQKKNFTSDSQLINYLVANYDGEGLSVSTLKARFRDGANLTERKKK